MLCFPKSIITCALSLPPSSIHCNSSPAPISLPSPSKSTSLSLNGFNDTQTRLSQPVIPLFNANFPPYSSLIQSCIDSQSFDAGRSIHGRMLSEGLVPDAYLQTKILMLYARSGNRGDLATARKMFDEMPERNSTAWNTMILAYSREKDHEEVFKLFFHMLRDGASPGKFTFPSVIKGCIALDEREAVSQLQSLIIKVGLNSNLVVGGALVDSLAGFGWMNDAVAAFDEINGDNVFIWNSLLGGYMKLSMLEETWCTFHEMLSVGAVPDHFTYATVIRSCGSLKSLTKGKLLHSYTIISGYESDVFIANSLIDMYACCDDECSSRMVFELIREKNQVSWNSIIASYAHLGLYDEALHQFSTMQASGHQFDRFNLGSSLVACAALADLDMGRQFHGYLLRRSLHADLILGTAVVDMYSKCGCPEKAHRVFDELEERSELSWNALISGYVQEENVEAVIHLHHKMSLEIPPDEFALSNLLSLAANQESLDLGKQIHAYITRVDAKLNVVVETELLNMYVRCNRLREAESIFYSMKERNNYSWNCLMDGYEENGNYLSVLFLFYQMQLKGMKPDSFSLASALSSCIGLSDVSKGKQIHGFMIRNRIEDHKILRCMLVDLYGKCKVLNYAYKVHERAQDKDVYLNNVMISVLLECGIINKARELFEEMGERTLVSWNMMLMGYSKYGFRNEAFRLFFRLAEDGVIYGSLTLVPLFNLCASLPGLELGEMLHAIVIKRGFSYSLVVLDSAMVDMYSKCGSLEDARRYFDHMGERNIVAWNSMLTGYGKHGRSSDVFELYKQMLKENVKPSGVTFLALLSACSHNGLVEKGISCFIDMLEEDEVDVRAEHYTCMVDLLGRAGFLEEAHQVINNMPIDPEVSTWGALLGACRLHKEVDLGQLVAEKLFQIDSENSGHYILMANLYSSVGMWKEADHIRQLMRSRGVKKEPGISWIQIDNEVHTFHAGDRNHPLAEEIYRTMKDLTRKMKRMGYVPDDNFVLRNVEDKEEYLLQHSERLAVGLGLIKLDKRSVIRVYKNLRICGDCHIAIKLISEITGRTILVRDISRFHHFKDGVCSCGDYW
ncbi:putative pentatricopeptide repeat-containing protein At3g13770, mitochondrial [Phalaenopsis equestris]|uniref:putative pentatricopeptide repeat-containing protein At3g13770, mitochondrial n=1 Tax=Phalaenopsis equestris TaxID=78828 RepID=UPI0009E3ADFE|nr:putative pentatricopeptide repeat-containing protein At3g13770, mitochondrial [Phalaenopsis equestris]XP_020584445.1 putative pentatricopeptide repeat-containing protein At3g13770, mitochondrial [Phalaenopsis equestris]